MPSAAETHRALPPKTSPHFADVRRNAEMRLKLGLKLDFEQIMADIAAIRAGH
jgi:hypothetical protein